MSIQVGEVDGVPVLAPDGPLKTAADAALLGAQLSVVSEKGGTRVIVDCTSVTLLGSAALRVLLQAGRRLRAKGGGLVIAAVGPRVRRALEVSGFQKDIAMAADVAEAVAALPARMADPREEAARAILQALVASAPEASRAERERLRPTAEALLEALAPQA